MLLAALLAAASATAPACDSAHSIPADVRIMARAPRRWLGRCVRLDGFVGGRYFFADAGGAYAELADDHEDHRNDGWVGLYFEPTVGRQPLQRGTVVGRVQDCGHDYAAEAARAGPNTIVMSIGYCHYQSGLILTSAAFRSSGPAQFGRLMAPADRARFGNLEAERGNLRAPVEVVALADRFLAGVLAGDGAGLATFVGYWSELNPDTPAGRSEQQAYLAGEPGSPLRPIRLATRPPQRTYFRERRSRDQESWGWRPVWHICFCRTGDCTGRWPIHSVDATAGPNRPYACVRATNGEDPREPQNHVAIDRRESMFVEPAANNSTR